MEVFNANNSPISPVRYNKNKLLSIRYAAADNDNNIWLIAGWEAYKYDGKDWFVFDSLNSPISWARKIFIDKSNNAWLASSQGVAKYDGNEWTVMDTINWAATFAGIIKMQEK